MSTKKNEKPDIKVGMKVQQKQFAEGKDGVYRPKHIVYDVLAVDDIYVTIAPENNHALDLRMTWDMARVRIESNMLTIIPDPKKIVQPRMRCKLVELTETNKHDFSQIIGSLKKKIPEAESEINADGYPIDMELRDRRN